MILSLNLLTLYALCVILSLNLLTLYALCVIQSTDTVCTVCDISTDTVCTVCDIVTQSTDTVCTVCDIVTQSTDTVCTVCDIVTQSTDTVCTVVTQSTDTVCTVCDIVLTLYALCVILFGCCAGVEQTHKALQYLEEQQQVPHWIYRRGEFTIGKLWLSYGPLFHTYLPDLIYTREITNMEEKK